MRTDLLPGRTYPLGATLYPDGVNFCLYSHHGTAVDLLLFDDVEDQRPSRIIQLYAARNKTSHYWHVFVPKIKSGQLYAYRMHGPYNPKRGWRFDGEKVLLDPYTRAVAVGSRYDRLAATRPGDNCATAMKSVVVDTKAYDWEGDKPLSTPYEKTIIYEMHVSGFTRNPNSGVAPEKRGTYAGLIEKIPYLKSLGISAVELLPIQQFDEQDAPYGLINYWGYSPLAFFAPHNAYSSRRDPTGPVDEFRDMVKALHKAGIEVILDVVFNHTAEGSHQGPLFSFRGLDDQAYYMLDEQGNYLNYTGCGNTLNANHSVVRRLIMDSLRHWVAEMHVDGFRFDLASVLSRDEKGVPLVSPPVLWEIDSDPVLAGAKIIAEAWDAAGLYQVGSFVGDRFREWNGQFRDDLRRFVKGDTGMTKLLMHRIAGSRDLYPEHAKRSINFVTCHDGFTLNDLVSYNGKHNEANLQNNTDGADDNCAWNCGMEGPTDKPEINQLRTTQMKNLLVLLLLSQGTPMLLMGDEVCRTQAGNNNGYCQNNELSWFDWIGPESNASMLRFMKYLVQLRQKFELFKQDTFLDTTGRGDGPGIIWHGVQLAQPDLGFDSRSLAFTLRYPERGEYIHVMLNAWWEKLVFEIPPPPTGRRWLKVIDTAAASPQDICEDMAACSIKGNHCELQPRSTLVLVAENH